MILQADWLWDPGAPPIRNGWIRVEGSLIAAIGSGGNPAELPAGEPVRRLDGCVLLPGLINAHCHLELTTLSGRLDRGKPFPTWVEQLRGYTAGLTNPDYRRAAREGVRLLLAGGCTAVLDVGNTGDALPVLAAGPLRAIGCIEILGLDPALAGRRAAAGISKSTSVPATERFRSGVAPHAAYSCSPELIAAARRHQTDQSLPFTIHAAESREESELFASSTGPLAEYCRRIHAEAPRHRDTTPVQWLEREGLLPDGALIIHGNLLDDTDLDILARRGAAVVHCPSSHAFFGHPRFPLERLRARGIPVCLGTDSAASGDSLSMLEQVRLFRATYPEVSADDALAMATVNAAKALGWGGRLGSLRAGYAADVIAVRTGTTEDPLEAVFREGARVTETVIDGEMI